MGARSVIIGGGIAALAAGCGGSKTPAQPPGPADPLQSVTFKEVTGMLRGADSAAPKCPVRPHFEATLLVSHMQGTLTYRWERAHGDSTIRTIDIPAGAKSGMVELQLHPDEWSSSERGVQVTVTDRVHVLTPINRVSPAVDVEAKCY
jgi:hypothetical protein